MRHDLQGGRRLRGGRRLLPRRAHRAARRRQRHRSRAEGGDAYAQTRRGARGARSRRPASSEPRRRTCCARGCSSCRAATGRAPSDAHREAFAGVDPANTTYFVSGFIPEGVLVEVELDAIVPEPPR